MATRMHEWWGTKLSARGVNHEKKKKERKKMHFCEGSKPIFLLGKIEISGISPSIIEHNRA